MCDQLEKTFKDVAKSSIAQDEEGNVLYFIKKGENDNDKVLSLAKLKTLEYRLFRKMREKLRGFYHLGKTNKDVDIADLPKDKFEKIKNKFVRESKEFLADGQNDLPQPLDYYVHIFSSAYDFIEQDPSQLELLKNEYVTFSENLLKYISN